MLSPKLSFVEEGKWPIITRPGSFWKEQPSFSWRPPPKAVAVWLEAMGELGHSRAKDPSDACLPNLIIQSLWDQWTRGGGRQEELNLESEWSEFTYEDCLILRICSLISLGKSPALPNHQFLHLNMDIQCEVWKSMSARPQNFFTYEELWPRDGKQLAEDHTADKGPSQDGHPVGVGLKCGSTKEANPSQSLPWYLAVQSGVPKSSWNTCYVPGGALRAEVAAANESAHALKKLAFQWGSW